MKRIRSIIKSKIEIIDLAVVGCSNDTRIVPNASNIDINIDQIFEENSELIKELADVDVWNISRQATLDQLARGEIGYIAKHKDRIVATIWAVIKNRYYDTHLMREFILANKEVYYWRAWTIPEFRGYGILPYLQDYIFNDVTKKYKKNIHLALIRGDNMSSLKAVSKFGWRIIGRAGMIRAGRAQLHYLYGRNAFKETKRRIFIRVQ